MPSRYSRNDRQPAKLFTLEQAFELVSEHFVDAFSRHGLPHAEDGAQRSSTISKPAI